MDPGIRSFDVALGLLGGLALFLFGMSRLSDPLKELGGDRVRQMLERFTNSTLGAIVMGMVATAVLGSSSVVIILTIALVNAGLLRFDRSLGVVMGANVGTTVSSQLFAVELDRFAPLGLAAGLLLATLARQRKAKLAGTLLFDVSVIFFGLGQMGEATAPLRDHEGFLRWMREMEHPLVGAGVGALFTAVLQSSSAVLGVIIRMAGEGLITLAAGIALMMGAEIGTCADTLLATLGRSRAAVRTGVFHLAFNIASVVCGLLAFPAFVKLVDWLSAGGNVGQQIANAHLAFNLAGVVAFAWFVRPAQAVLRRIIPDTIETSESREPGPVAEEVLLAEANPDATA